MRIEPWASKLCPECGHLLGWHGPTLKTHHCCSSCDCQIPNDRHVELRTTDLPTGPLPPPVMSHTAWPAEPKGAKR